MSDLHLLREVLILDSDCPDWRMTLRSGGWVLECQDSAMNHWVEMDGPGSLKYCEYAYEQRCNGEQPLNYDDWNDE